MQSNRILMFHLIIMDSCAGLYSTITFLHTKNAKLSFIIILFTSFKTPYAYNFKYLYKLLDNKGDALNPHNNDDFKNRC